MRKLVCWSMSARAGVRCLAHTCAKGAGRRAAALAMLLAGLGALTGVAAPTVTLSKVQQRYPWNGLVDIDYEIAGISTGETDGLQLEVRAKDEMSKAEFVAEKGFQYAPSVTAGKHRVTWNTAADNAVIYSSNVTVTVTLKKPKTPPLYVVIDLSAPESFGINYLDAVPEGGWTDDYKTSKLVLRRIEAGQFVMGAAETDPVNPHSVILTKPYYIGVFEVTYGQWNRVMGTSSSSSYSTKPKCEISYNDIRGGSLGTGWPQTGAVDESSFMGRLRSKTGVNRFDLPTEAQWEYASKAGVNSTVNVAGVELNSLAVTPEDFKYNYKSGIIYYLISSLPSAAAPKSVGTKVENSWGLFDCLGNVQEWCLDWYVENVTGSVDPFGPDSGTKRVVRGGSCVDFLSSTVSRTGCEPASTAKGTLRTGYNDYLSSGDKYKYSTFSSSGFRVCYHGEL